MSDLYQNNNFSTKLYYTLETYLNVLMYGGNMFFNIPSIQLPKSASNVFLEAVQILRACQKVTRVLGGAILYHNKVVATQLASNVTKWLILTDPYRIKSPAEIIQTDFQLPAGMQLLQVYIEEDDYEDLRFEATRLQSIHFCLENNSQVQTKTNQVKEPVLMTMKRDQSLIFTTVPEEDSDHTTSTVKTKTQRPKFLNLKSKTTDIKQELKETGSFHGSVSVCSTPMADLNRVLHQTSLSICTNPQSSTFEVDTENSQKSDSLNSLLSATSDLYVEGGKSDNGVKPAEKSEEDNNLCNIKKSFSLTDMPKYDEKDESDSLQKNLRKTIMDPTFPVFTQNGLLISEHLYNYNIYNGELLALQSDEMKKPSNNNDENKDNLVESKASELNSQQSDVTPKKFVPSRDNIKFKRSLTLPLKSLSNDMGSQQNVVNFNNPTGVQLTPLLSKLSTLAMEERSSGFCSIENTPSDFKDIKTSLKRNALFRSNSNKVESNVFSSHQKDKRLQSVILLIYG
ncbi:hypothetical protein AMK59_8503 [Oryctes borbonicus]|uniref:CCZ1/INTU/HSP4 first Longin domain-containing protein n=1 Tax=Oryctes borbonicus TaxID=1629725 RepID=A0A0T6AW45_9SCAR|nr:hypothetical protein AMK59_8503 [Oryctes borbonicus]